MGGYGCRRSGPQHGRLEETVLEPSEAPEKVLVLDITGIISSFTVDRGGAGMVDWVDDQLDRAEEDYAIKAVILKVDSPEVKSSPPNLTSAFVGFRRTLEAGHCQYGGLAAGGGYYVSAPCRWIVAHPLTITGSIGVIMHGYNYRDLMDKVGVAPNVFKSGRFKDMLRWEKRNFSRGASPGSGYGGHDLSTLQGSHSRWEKLGGLSGW